FVSRADLKSEAVIREELMSARPNYGWLAEESEEVQGADPTRRWIVDPLDGTTNFLHGMPHWAISIALEHKGEIVSAIVFDPIKDEMFTAEKGSGAWMNDRRMRVSDRRDMLSMVFATGIPFAANPTLPRWLRQSAALSPMCAGLRRWGAASLDLAYVAAGRFDGYWEITLSPWDKAAGVLLVREAGGLVEGLTERTGPIEDPGVIAANPDAFGKFAQTLRGT
ncbi:MAG: inositol monophosphatase family protein, partial [Pseudomonadota bacterium]